jgi:hypothetical protein
MTEPAKELVISRLVTLHDWKGKYMRHQHYSSTGDVDTSTVVSLFTNEIVVKAYDKGVCHYFKVPIDQDNASEYLTVILQHLEDFKQAPIVDPGINIGTDFVPMVRKLTIQHVSQYLDLANVTDLTINYLVASEAPIELRNFEGRDRHLIISSLIIFGDEGEDNFREFVEQACVGKLSVVSLPEQLASTASTILSGFRPC